MVIVVRIRCNKRTGLDQMSVQWERVHRLTWKDEQEDAHDISVCARTRRKAIQARARELSASSRVVYTCVWLFLDPNGVVSPY